MLLVGVGTEAGVGALLLLKILLFNFAISTRSRGISLSFGGREIRGILTSVGDRANVDLIFDSRLISIGHGMAVRLGSIALGRTLAELLSKVGLAFRVEGGGVCFVRGGTISRPNSEGGEIAKIIGSMVKRPLVNTGIIRGNEDAGKIVASFGKGFALRISRSTSLIIDCVKCLTRSVPAGKGKSFRVVLGRSAGALSRIIIAKCKSFGGTACAKSTSILAARGLRTLPIISIKRVVRSGVPNVDIITNASSRPNTGAALQMQKITSVGTSARPLCMLSKMPVPSCSLDGFADVSRTKKVKFVRALGPTSVRDVAILGSTTSTSLCNTGNTGKIILVAAGGKGRNGLHIGVTTGCKVASFTCACHPLVKNRREEGLVRRKLIGFRLSGKMDRRRTRRCTSTGVSRCTGHLPRKCSS